LYSHSSPRDSSSDDLLRLSLPLELWPSAIATASDVRLDLEGSPRLLTLTPESHAARAAAKAASLAVGSCLEITQTMNNARSITNRKKSYIWFPS
jgi:hypothetical protein